MFIIYEVDVKKNVWVSDFGFDYYFNKGETDSFYLIPYVLAVAIYFL